MPPESHRACCGRQSEAGGGGSHAGCSAKWSPWWDITSGCVAPAGTTAEPAGMASASDSVSTPCIGYSVRANFQCWLHAPQKSSTATAANALRRRSTLLIVMRFPPMITSFSRRACARPFESHRSLPGKIIRHDRYMRQSHRDRQGRRQIAQLDNAAPTLGMDEFKRQVYKPGQTRGATGRLVPS